MRHGYNMQSLSTEHAVVALRLPVWGPRMAQTGACLLWMQCYCHMTRVGLPTSSVTWITTKNSLLLPSQPGRVPKVLSGVLKLMVGNWPGSAICLYLIPVLV